MFKMVGTAATLIEENHYYPFGMNLEGSAFVGGGNPYRYNGKELNEDLGLGWYDYGARWYDPATGRWMGVDALAEGYLGWSPYNYVMGNPVIYIDPDGNRVDISKLRDKNSDGYNRLLSDLQNTTGLTLIVDNLGNVTFQKQKGLLGNDRAVIVRDDDGEKTGSSRARRMLIRAIKSSNTVMVDDNPDGGSRVNMESKSKGDRNTVLLDFNEINVFMKNASPDLNPLTMGPAVTFFHELGHTSVGGRSYDAGTGSSSGLSPQLQPGGNIRKNDNKIRRQLGQDYGARVTYMPPPMVGGHYYLPFSRKTKKQLYSGQAPTSRYILTDFMTNK